MIANGERRNHGWSGSSSHQLARLQVQLPQWQHRQDNVCVAVTAAAAVATEGPPIIHRSFFHVSVKTNGLRQAKNFAAAFFVSLTDMVYASHWRFAWLLLCCFIRQDAKREKGKQRNQLLVKSADVPLTLKHSQIILHTPARVRCIAFSIFGLRCHAKDLQGPNEA